MPSRSIRDELQNIGGVGINQPRAVMGGRPSIQRPIQRPMPGREPYEGRPGIRRPMPMQRPAPSAGPAIRQTPYPTQPPVPRPVMGTTPTPGAFQGGAVPPGGIGMAPPPTLMQGGPPPGLGGTNTDERNIQPLPGPFPTSRGI